MSFWDASLARRLISGYLNIVEPWGENKVFERQGTMKLEEGSHLRQQTRDILSEVYRALGGRPFLSEPLCALHA